MIDVDFKKQINTKINQTTTEVNKAVPKLKTIPALKTISDYQVILNNLFLLYGQFDITISDGSIRRVLAFIRTYHDNLVEARELIYSFNHSFIDFIEKHHAIITKNQDLSQQLQDDKKKLKQVQENIQVLIKLMNTYLNQQSWRTQLTENVKDSLHRKVADLQKTFKKLAFILQPRLKYEGMLTTEEMQKLTKGQSVPLPIRRTQQRYNRDENGVRQQVVGGDRESGMRIRGSGRSNWNEWRNGRGNGRGFQQRRLRGGRGSNYNVYNKQRNNFKERSPKEKNASKNESNANIDQKKSGDGEVRKRTMSDLRKKNDTLFKGISGGNLQVK